MVKVTKEFIVSGRTGPGGWCAAQLRMLGVKWPPAKGWIEAVEGKGIELDDESAGLFLGYAAKTVSKTKLRKHNRKASKPAKRKRLEQKMPALQN